MADYWKSQPKKFCDYCKCWIADNRPSIDFHERGKNHKENVTKRISEIKKKSLEKAKEEENMSKEFAAMEEAAMKAYQEDLKRLGIKPDVGPSSTQSKTEEKKGKKEKKEKKEKKKKMSQDTSGPPKGEKKEWVQGLSPEGYTYYYNTTTGESQWEKPKGFQDGSPKSKTTAEWVEGVSEDGHTYYYNTQTGVSTWEKPAGFVSSSNEKSQRNKHAGDRAETDSKASESDSEDDSGSEDESPERNSKRKGDNDEETEENKSPKAKTLGVWREVNLEEEMKRETTSILQEISKDASKTTSEASMTTKPYGTWKSIKTEEDDTCEKVDLELPSAEDDNATSPALEVPEDGNVIFKEKTVTSLGDVSEGVPVFKKRKFENGKSRNLRQRLSDQ